MTTISFAWAFINSFPFALFIRSVRLILPFVPFRPNMVGYIYPALVVFCDLLRRLFVTIRAISILKRAIIPFLRCRYLRPSVLNFFLCIFMVATTAAGDVAVCCKPCMGSSSSTVLSFLACAHHLTFIHQAATIPGSVCAPDSQAHRERCQLV